MITARAFAGKYYAVLGLARSGLATVEALVASGAKVTAWDDKPEARAKVPAGVELEDFVNSDLSRFDSIIVTPGLPLNRHPIAQRAADAGVEIIGDIELFARARAELSPHKVIGITGTNGKSTTTALIHHLLKTAGVPTEMGGNIGLPILAQDPLPEGGVYVLELSSYQIDLTKSLDCDVAVLLNITPDHLDRYDGFEAYAASKARLFEMQSNGHSAIIALDDEPSLEIAKTLGDRLIPVSTTKGRDWRGPTVAKRGLIWKRPHLCVDGDQFMDQAEWPALQGPHNAQNAVAAAAVSQELGIAPWRLADGLRTYPGLPHRMERVREKDCVLFVNDSKATNPTATAPALAAFPKIRWILGGQAKTDNLDECAPHFRHVRKAYTIGEAGEMFASLLSPQMAVAECVTLAEAVKAAASEAQAGDTVLLSPACASFDQFRDFEARGDAFRALVGEL
ncbi:UDP-N-acetylmuramoyl-L-alanine--D-glutamate ligase [Sphingomonas sp. G124]|uniref:UDP-N-acetylmuramoylalanine--D-glutamate ligase n=1 Tax=Sphingomonas cremea TaxID=2904799 RepID=A0A9X1QL28_9SPHN|nr:UDP-N-acetylmuramoyl-L-alanine--D-glutamate ligase [Sphingomonas cremea]MCF2515656.1 UDP-N-acetylmuramoyl-L-alanine--D-glutamate ligase [Sphingomonas cremea]